MNLIFKLLYGTEFFFISYKSQETNLYYSSVKISAIIKYMRFRQGIRIFFNRRLNSHVGY